MKRLIIIASLAVWAFSCNDELEPIALSPEITFVSVSNDTIVQFQEVLTITISYIDGDGDLGENDPDIKNLFVTDSRNDVTFEFRIPQLAPAGSPIIIEGNLPIELSGVAIINSGAQTEQVSYTISVIDRAGNQSNVVSTPEITLIR